MQNPDPYTIFLGVCIVLCLVSLAVARYFEVKKEEKEQEEEQEYQDWLKERGLG